MKYVEVIAESGSADTLTALAEKVKAEDLRLGVVGGDGMQQSRLLVVEDRLQSTLDALQNILGAQPTARILVLDVEVALPKLKEEEDELDDAVAARELLLEDAGRNARLDWDFITLIVLSTIVAAIGLIENNVAVLIGAMVIAPLLGPNLALSLGTALGDTALMGKAAKALFVGIALAVGLSAVLGFVYPSELVGQEIISRTEPGLESIVLALVSGAAAALSVTIGLSSVLVGVMVAVALLPPAATFGLMLGKGEINLAIGAGLLLAANIASVNLASKIVFLFKGIHPRTGVEQEKANRAMVLYVLVWIATLVVLGFVIFSRQTLAG